MKHCSKIQALLPCAAAVLALTALALAPLASAQGTQSFAVLARTLNPLEAAAVDGLAAVPQADLNLRPSAAVSVWANGQGTGKQAVQRRNLGVDAAVFAGAPHSNPPLLPSRIGASLAPHDGGNAAQAWATMTAQGVPHLFVQGYGDFRAEGTAAWTGKYTLAGSTSRELVLRFMVPPTVVSGNFEQDGPAWWRSQMRAEVLVNGFPVWSTTALRLLASDPAAGNPGAQPLEVLQLFGDPLSFPTNDEDQPAAYGGPLNDTDAGNQSQAADARVVYLSLGRFYPGQQLELSMVLRGTAFTEPRVPQTQLDLRDNRCKPRPDAGWFCSRATMSMRMGNMAPQLTLLP